jgi:predicted RNA-binding protein (virulence factor B family)
MDLSLQKIGVQHLVDTTDKVLVYLQKNKGVLSLTDDSTPVEIKSTLNMSKKAFKKSIGILYKQRMIRIEKDGVYLV